MATASGRRRGAVAALPAAKAPAKAETSDTGAEFRLLAQGHAGEALAALVWLAANAASEAVRVSAANAVIDRAFGRPSPAIRIGGEGGADDGQGVSLRFEWLDPGKS